MPDKYGDRVRLEHVIDAIDRINTYVGSDSFAMFQKDFKLQDACIRQLQVIGEACNRVTKEIQSAHLEIPWPIITGLRNIVIHDYAGIDQEVIWNIIKNDLPELYSNIGNILIGLPVDE